MKDHPAIRCLTIHPRNALVALGMASACLLPLGYSAEAPPASVPVPQSVSELWADFDPRADPLATEVIREWKEPGATYRHVRFFVGTFKGQPARMAAIYGFPDGNAKRPGVMHIHGGGQRASLSEVKFLVARGYAALSLNWGGDGDGQGPFNAVEGAQPGDPNTDWGVVDPTQLNAQAYSSLLPGPKQLFDDREHPKNNNWYLLTLGCRRGLTFLERQPEVDPQRLGVHGFSMGGNLTMYVAATDSRVKAAVPGVGGQGWRWQPHEFFGGQAQEDHIRGNTDLFRATLSFESYAPLIRCPVLHRSATNDFHGWMDDVYRTNALIPGQPTRYCWTPHLNHRLSPEVAVAMPLWFDQFLKDGPALPETPPSELVLHTPGHLPELRVTTRHAWPVARCEMFFSVDPDPRVRFWRSAEVTRSGDTWVAPLPLHTAALPLFAFANLYYNLPEPLSMAALPGYGEPVRQVCISSLLHSITADQLRSAGVLASAAAGPLIDDFSHGLRDWYQLNAGHPGLVETWTRKLTDPLYQGADDAALRLTLRLPETNRLTFVVIENEWRNDRGPKKTFTCTREIPGAAGEQSVTLPRSAFRGVDPAGSPLTAWKHVDQFGICARYTEPRRNSGKSTTPTTAATPPKPWTGPAPEFRRLEWVADGPSRR